MHEWNHKMWWMHFLGDTNNWTTRSLPNYLNDLPLEFFFRYLFLIYVVVIVFALFLPLSVFVFAILEQKKVQIYRTQWNKQKSFRFVLNGPSTYSFIYTHSERKAKLCAMLCAFFDIRKVCLNQSSQYFRRGTRIKFDNSFPECTKCIVRMCVQWIKTCKK